MSITHVCLFSDDGVITRIDASKDPFELDIPALKTRYRDFKFFAIYHDRIVLFSAVV